MPHDRQSGDASRSGVSLREIARIGPLEINVPFNKAVFMFSIVPMHRSVLILAVVLAAMSMSRREVTATPPAESEPKPEPVRVIFDSDMAGDADDVAALAVLHALADQGHAKILAVGASERNPWTPLCMDAINTYYGRSDIPIGVTKDQQAYHNESKYTKGVAERFARARDWDSAEDAPSAVSVYREVLAEQPDDSVVLITVGTLCNTANLLKSKPDKHSDLSGRELVDKKVRHLVSMAGIFGPLEGNREANLIKDTDAAQSTTKHWPTRITFCGYLIGRFVQTGADLMETPENNPVRYAYKVGKDGKDSSSFDQVTTLFAVRALDDGPLADLWTLSDWGTVEVQHGGTNSFTKDQDGRHRYIRPFSMYNGRILRKHRQPDRVAKIVEGLMTRPPQHR